MMFINVLILIDHGVTKSTDVFCLFTFITIMIQSKNQLSQILEQYKRHALYKINGRHKF